MNIEKNEQLPKIIDKPVREEQGWCGTGGLWHIQCFERIEPIVVFVRISFGIADHSGLTD
jgi:hypothetical protein